MLLRRNFIALSALAFGLEARAAAVVGQPAPEFSLTDTNGKTVKLSDYRGKHVVLEWTNPGCPYVQKHYNSGNMPATQREAVDKGVVWLAINSTEKTSSEYLEPPRLVDWMKERKSVTSATLLDAEGTTGRSYGARTTPHLYIVDPQGKLVYAGGIDSIASSRAEDIKTAVNYVRQGLGEALAGKPISMAVTRPYGCSIKYKA